MRSGSAERRSRDVAAPQRPARRRASAGARGEPRLGGADVTDRVAERDGRDLPAKHQSHAPATSRHPALAGGPRSRSRPRPIARRLRAAARRRPRASPSSAWTPSSRPPFAGFGRSRRAGCHSTSERSRRSRSRSARLSGPSPRATAGSRAAQIPRRKARSPSASARAVTDALVVEGVSVRRGGHDVVRDVDVRLAAGRVCGLLGRAAVARRR